MLVNAGRKGYISYTGVKIENRAADDAAGLASYISYTGVKIEVEPATFYFGIVNKKGKKQNVYINKKNKNIPSGRQRRNK